MSTDHSDYQSKIFVRQKGLALIKPPYRVIELYAGAGVLTQNLWLKVADEVLSIEREPDKFKLSHPNLTTITENCTYHIDKIANYNVIDCDAYGLVLPVLLKCIDHANPGSIIFFTEFNPIRYKKDWE